MAPIEVVLKNTSQSILGPLTLQLQKVCKMAGSHSNIYLYTTNPVIKSQGADYRGFVMINKVICIEDNLKIYRYINNWKNLLFKQATMRGNHFQSISLIFMQPIL